MIVVVDAAPGKERLGEVPHGLVAAEALKPRGYPIFARRPCLDTEYYETYNRPNVHLVDVKADPIVVEWNAYRYVPLPKGDGVALFAVSRRGYGEEGARAFLGGLGTMRSQILKEFATYSTPVVSIAP